MFIPLRKLTGPSARSLVAVLASALLLWGTNKGPDGASYMATDGTVYSFIDLTGGGNSASVLTGADDDVALLTLPFPFQFYGNSYTLLCVSSNGVISFVTAAAACTAQNDFANTDLTATAPPGDLPSLLPYWTDLTFQTAGSGAVYYATQGPVGGRKFVVQWNNAFIQGTPLSVTFEVVLSEGANSILFQYKTVDLQDSPASDGAISTIGIRATGGNITNRQIAWSYNAAVLSNGKAILFTPPASGQTSVNTISSNPPGLTVSVDGSAIVTPTVVTWIPGTSHTLSVVGSQVNGGTQNQFTGWSTGATTTSIPVTAQNPGTSYTANFSMQYQLTTGVNPANGGTITAGGWFAAGSVVSVSATPAGSYLFSSFSGDLTGTTNPQPLTMNGPKGVVANFRAGGTPSIVASVAGKADGSTGTRVWTIRLTNTGLGTAAGAQITGIVLTQTAGTPCAPAATVASAFPIVVGDVAPSSNATSPVTLNLGGCTDTTDRFSAKVSFAANAGTYSSSTTISNQTK